MGAAKSINYKPRNEPDLGACPEVSGRVFYEQYPAARDDLIAIVLHPRDNPRGIPAPRIN